MKERPILFSGAMVRALLVGTKTQTRRVMKTEAALGRDALFAPRGSKKHAPTFLLPDATVLAVDHCPYGKAGDRLWVRETFMDLRGTGVEHRMKLDDPLQRYAYGADSPPGSYGDETRKDYGLKWKPSIHMPRAASRITLEISSVRVERLQDISPDDCIAEGAWPIEKRDLGRGHEAVAAFRSLWEGINGPDSWVVNPWVWAVEFKRTGAPA